MTRSFAIALLSLLDLGRKFAFQGGVLFGLYQFQHRAEILHTAVHLAPGLKLPLQDVFLLDRLLSGTAVGPEVCRAHALVKSLYLGFQRRKVKDASEDHHTWNEDRSGES